MPMQMNYHYGMPGHMARLRIPEVQTWQWTQAHEQKHKQVGSHRQMQSSRVQIKVASSEFKPVLEKQIEQSMHFGKLVSQ